MFFPARFTPFLPLSGRLVPAVPHLFSVLALLWALSGRSFVMASYSACPRTIFPATLPLPSRHFFPPLDGPHPGLARIVLFPLSFPGVFSLFPRAWAFFRPYKCPFFSCLSSLYVRCCGFLFWPCLGFFLAPLVFGS